MRDQDPGADPRLIELADRMSRGEEIDWSRELRRSDVSDAAVLESLRTLAAIHELHTSQRGLDMPEVASGGTPAQWGSLQIRGHLGRGSHGTVLRAFDPNLRREVALKLLRAGEDASTQQRLLSEGRRLAQVRHPHVVAVHGAQENDGCVGLWMERIEGRTLAAHVGEHGPLGEDEARALGSTLCRAAAAVHAAGLVHRDIKAQNVMREEGGRVVLMDFGAVTESGLLGAAGTPMYLAPELLGGEAATEASDIYALGMTLYHLVTGGFPYRVASVHELRVAQKKGRASLADVRPDLSPEFVGVVERALHVDPAQRFGGAGEMAMALLPALASPSSAAGAPVAARRDVRRAAWVATAAVALLALVAVVIPRLLAPGEFTVEATVLRHHAAERSELTPGASVRVGDELGLRFRSSQDVHLYVLNEDATGAAYLLFPLPVLALQNPLSAESSVLLPGRLAGEGPADEVWWGVDSAAGEEQLLFVAARDPVPELEDLIATLTPATLEEVGYPRLDESVRARLRGIGRLHRTRSTPAPESRRGALNQAAGIVAGPDRAADGVWVRSFRLHSR